ncbi:bifunctional glycosyltransferase family 2/GtrA family protein [Demequina soli]|uniref:bifunctional glycosyltransferase family 2/GtrA family protein n=1 Tax=Demequina soli TaxID=1638987 RepID=UPI000783E72A|nr:bifunctional glycosyltransferase family 2/GtrA family protein [Demequina soli]
MRVLIPAYEPDARLVDLVAALRPGAAVVVVDDGSGPAHRPHFDACEALGATVLRHPANRGKAAALRTGFAWALAHAPGEAVVCADSDGQHTVEDIGAVAAALASARDDAVVLGVRAFAGDVPLRSRVGNRATTALLAAATGRRVTDTQTGLRGYPAALLPWALGVRGERFAYELELLLAASRRGIATIEVPIATVYLSGNASSHFRPLVDSARVMRPLVLFAASSLIAFGVDTVALLALSAATGSLAAAVVGARVLSASTNFAINRRTVFRSRGRVGAQAVRYAALAGVLLFLSYSTLRTLTELGVPLLAAKVATDAVLWALSYGIQRSLVFAPTPSPAAATESTTVTLIAHESGARTHV